MIVVMICVSNQKLKTICSYGRSSSPICKMERAQYSVSIPEHSGVRRLRHSAHLFSRWHDTVRRVHDNLRGDFVTCHSCELTIRKLGCNGETSYDFFLFFFLLSFNLTSRMKRVRTWSTETRPTSGQSSTIWDTGSWCSTAASRKKVWREFACVWMRPFWLLGLGEGFLFLCGISADC